MKATFQHGTFTYEGDPTDYRFLERWEDALEAFNAARQTALEHERESQKIKGFVDAIADFFDGVFGDGTAKKVLGESTSFDEAFSAFETVCAFSSAGAQSITSRANKYLPKGKRSKG